LQVGVPTQAKGLEERRLTEIAASHTAAPPRGAPRSKKGVRTRSRLIEAAKGVFERVGFLDARIVDISEAASVGFGTFYHYFDSKEEIFREVASAQEARLIAAPVEQPEYSADDNNWALIQDAVRTYLERYRDEASLMGVIEQVSRYDEQVAAGRAATMDHFARQWERNIELLQRDGRCDLRVEAPLAADALRAMITRFAEMWLVEHHRDYDFDQVVEQLTLMCANAIGLKPQRKSPSSRRKRS
jgi:AcrR family transcriptional regulator